MDRVNLLVACLTFAAIATADAPIYRCEVDGVLTFSDRPCGPESRPYSPDETLVSTYDAPPRASATTSARKPPRERPRRDPQSANEAKRAEECERIRTALAEIRATMRAGYTAREGERLRAREAKLKQRSKARSCR
jgi:hypothetical protein